MIFNRTNPSEKYSSSLFLFVPPDKKIRALGTGEGFGAFKNEGKSLTGKVHCLFAKKLEIE